MEVTGSSSTKLRKLQVKDLLRLGKKSLKANVIPLYTEESLEDQGPHTKLACFPKMVKKVRNLIELSCKLLELPKVLDL